jgi:prolipoprotein diacylglyceryltransferase
MHPVLFSIGGLDIYTYGVFVTLGLFVGLLLLEKQHLYFKMEWY